MRVRYSDYHELTYKERTMIRMNPAHDTTNSPGQVVPNKVRHFPAYKQSKSLAQEVAEYLAKEEKDKKVVDKK